MSDILNLALKKDVYEGINNGTIDKIQIEWSNWWNKRLKDIDTGKFKDFVVARISCGSALKIDYPILSIEQIDRDFVITVDNQGSESYVDTCLNQQDNDKYECKNDCKTETYQEQNMTDTHAEDEQSDIDESLDVEDIYEKSEIEDTDNNIKTNDNIKYDINTLIDNIIDQFCDYYRTYNINSPVIRIMPDGKIIGCNKRLHLNIDCEMRIPFGYVEFVKYKSLSDDDFINIIKERLEEYMNNNDYIFINRNACGFTKRASGEDVFVLRLTIKKHYLLGR